MIDPRQLFYVLMAILIFLLVFIAPHHLYKLLPSDTADAERGCIASAYQATRHGHDLEANLEHCDKLSMAGGLPEQAE